VVELKSEAELELMSEAGATVARVLAAVRDVAAPGVSLLELDALAAARIEAAGARSSFLHYKQAYAPTPYPAVLCTSVNEVINHGIPSRRRLVEGDLLSVDCAVEINGFHGDSTISFTIGKPSTSDSRLIETTQKALDAGIAAARPGGRVGDISAAISRVARKAGYGIPDGFGGHGIGRRMHEDPAVPNDGKAGRGMRLVPGLVLAIEPMLLAGGSDAFEFAEDGWAFYTRDGSRAVHLEHTVAITEDGPRVLTALPAT
jgi:methionyl aminopeptidase